MEQQITKDISAGWNDPPLFSYNDQLSRTNAAKRTVLNKRVVYKDSTSDTTTSQIDPTQPPSITSNIPPPPKCEITPDLLSESKTDGNDDNTENKEHKSKVDVLLSALRNLQCVIDDKEELKSNEAKKDLIKRRIDIMRVMWLDDKLSPEIQKEIHKLSEFLRDGHKSEATQIQTRLMVDYPRLCSTWIPAIRMLTNL